ncbi:MAG: DUF6516 family protein [Rhodospirillales bacterium]|nr:DUF6516 family protein [Rhodospirillales bacterium]
MGKAKLLFETKQILEDGAILQIRVWRVPEPVPPSEHSLKYSLYFGKDGKRLVSYDNERGKGDHRHIGNEEFPYNFTDIDTLIADFMADMKEARK